MDIQVDLGLRVSTGIAGLDELLHGGLLPRRAYLVRGGPGTGKTTVGFHFLKAGLAAGEKTMFITLAEPEQQLRKNAESAGFDLRGLSFLDLSPSSAFFAEVQTYDIFSSAEVEREPVTTKIVQYIKRIKPQRVFVDSMTQFRYLSSDAFQFHKQALSFLRFLVEKQATVVFTSEGSVAAPDEDLQFMSDGVIHLELVLDGRSIKVTKLRGSDFRTGTHAMRLGANGMEVFPRLLPEAHGRETSFGPVPSGVPELDALLHGGLERGTITLLSGPSGVGKTTVGIQFMKEAAGRGERSVVYTFEESVETILRRCENINIAARAMIERGTLSVVSIEPLRYSPDELANLARQQVELHNARIVMIDSTAGYQWSLQGENLVAHLHALCKYLKNMGVTVILVTEVETIAGGAFRISDVGISYLADNVIFMRYMERGMGKTVELRKVIGVLKKRVSDFEKTLREIEITRYGLKVGNPMVGVRGLLADMIECSVNPD